MLRRAMQETRRETARGLMTWAPQARASFAIAAKALAAIGVAAANHAGMASAAPASTVAKDDAKVLLNRGQDPFFRISSGMAGCPEPLGPRIDEAAWQRETHHRLERGYRCHAEGRCRLSNAYHYDREIAETVQRRLQWLSRQHRDAPRSWQQTLPQTSLWLTVSRRWVTIQGCVPPGFDPKPLADALREVEGVERVVIETTDGPQQRVPYTVLPRH